MAHDSSTIGLEASLEISACCLNEKFKPAASQHTDLRMQVLHALLHFLSRWKKSSTSHAVPLRYSFLFLQSIFSLQRPSLVIFLPRVSLCKFLSEQPDTSCSLLKEAAALLELRYGWCFLSTMSKSHILTSGDRVVTPLVFVCSPSCYVTWPSSRRHTCII